MSEDPVTRLCFTVRSSLGRNLSGTGDLSTADVSELFSHIRTAADVYEEVVTNPPHGITAKEVLRALTLIPSHRVTAATEIPHGLRNLLTLHSQMDAPLPGHSHQAAEHASAEGVASVGGHGGIISRAGGAIFQKPTNETERRFYEGMRDSGNELERIIAKSFTVDDVLTLESQISGGQIYAAKEVERGDASTDVFIENIASDFQEPVLLDIKIGESTASRSELLRHLGKMEAWQKKTKMKVADTVSGSSARGWRIASGSGIYRNLAQIGKNPINQLQDFIGFSESVASQIEKALREVRDVVARSDYAFVGSSVLVAVDRAGNDIQGSARVKLIDFAHAFTSEDLGTEQSQKYQIQFLKGIDNLIVEFRDFALVDPQIYSAATNVETDDPTSDRAAHGEVDRSTQHDISVREMRWGSQKPPVIRPVTGTGVPAGLEMDLTSPIATGHQPPRTSEAQRPLHEKSALRESSDSGSQILEVDAGLDRLAVSVSSVGQSLPSGRDPIASAVPEASAAGPDSQTTTVAPHASRSVTPAFPEVFATRQTSQPADENMTTGSLRVGTGPHEFVLDSTVLPSVESPHFTTLVTIAANLIKESLPGAERVDKPQVKVSIAPAGQQNVPAASFLGVQFVHKLVTLLDFSIELKLGAQKVNVCPPPSGLLHG
ncbi:inositol polyphosphate kinase family protein [Streptomyces sp. NPDC008061]|uniref:inositol polyphosphate kinase family protein n=1 Tax=Streptomyces sp. NPDC008061 TaxID=3364805 RepID=UPI0036F0240B